jgi:hypothetical protein
VARVFEDRVAFSTVTTGTGDIAVTAVYGSNFLLPSDVSFPDGDTAYLLILEGTDVEISRGTYTAAGPSFSRDSVIVSKIGGTVGTTKMTLAGEAVVRLAAAAEIIQAITLFTQADAAAPSDPQHGDRYFDLDTGIMFTYISDGVTDAWVEL